MTEINLAALPLPSVVEPLDVDSIMAALAARVIDAVPTLASAIAMNSEPVNAILRAAAYQELLLRQRVNEAVQQTYLSSATGTNLDQIGGLGGIIRKVLVAATTTTPEIKEADDVFRLRIQRFPETLSVAGPRAAYETAATNAHAEIVGASARSLTPGEVQIALLGPYEGGSIIPAGVAVTAAIEKIRPMTDEVSYTFATSQAVNVTATLTFLPGSGLGVVRDELNRRLLSRFRAGYGLNRGVARASIIASLFIENAVTNVTLAAPASDLVASPILAYTLGTVSLS